ncbi:MULTISPECIES: OmpP1/FadL family transporter [Alphaproteobacteria]|uniref:Long-chain fatty acid transporter n=2 Tax=Alphaproteobacteria TaxID=28211 RepID=A0A512HHL0_9HYPH|nr:MULTISPECIES: outer membrane protein transport protein [Alphaproteobacteria]GEO84870.1 long-chain fatty acid transporter [Ciceribacter naphthalenivorans]GLR22804.1 long-chain fatty acid transporter [Ciceribacter naphthalenivorans]GLT05660.1 long-chain fatty acid transporter [Sphingomonas psychrolutea]
MALELKKTAILCLLGVSALATSAHAGGWNRGEADTDILFEEGEYVARSGATLVSPRRDYETIGVGGVTVNGTDDDFSQNYWIPSIAAKIKLADNLACALTYTQPFGADADYGPQAQLASLLAGGSGASHKDFITNEYGATCDVNMQAGKGRFHVLGGVFLQDFEYTANAYVGDLHLQDHEAFGYRVGVAYDIPEYALRAQLMYRSKVEHNADDGEFDWNPAVRPGWGLQDAFGSGTLPQSLKLSLQSGVAPGWLVYGSVKWTDWSVMKSLDYSLGTPVPGLYSPQQDIYNWQDGWTIQAGVGHAFNEKFSSTINLTWDKGVATGADIYSDTWTVGAGVSIKAGPGDVRFGGAVSYLTKGSQSIAKDATYDATASADWAYAITANYKIVF